MKESPPPLQPRGGSPNSRSRSFARAIALAQDDKRIALVKEEKKGEGEGEKNCPTEKEIKGWKRLRKISLIESRNPTWEDLAKNWFLFPLTPFCKARA